MHLENLSLDELAELNDNIFNVLEQEELETLFKRYDEIRISNLLDQSPYGIRKYLEASKQEYLRTTNESEEEVILSKRLQKVRYLDEIQRLYKNFPLNLPNQRHRVDFTQPDTYLEEKIHLFNSINEILYPGREYKNLDEKLFPPEKFNNKNPDFSYLIKVSESVNRKGWGNPFSLRAKNKKIEYFLWDWNKYSKNFEKSLDTYMDFLIEETHLFMLLLKQGYTKKELTE